MSPFR